MPKFKENPTPFKMKGYSYPGTSPMRGKTIPVTRPNLITKHAPPANNQTKHTLRGKTGFEHDVIPVTNALNKAGGVIKKGLGKAKNIYIDKPIKTVKKIHKYFTER